MSKKTFTHCRHNFYKYISRNRTTELRENSINWLNNANIMGICSTKRFLLTLNIEVYPFLLFVSLFFAPWVNNFVFWYCWKNIEIDFRTEGLNYSYTWNIKHACKRPKDQLFWQLLIITQHLYQQPLTRLHVLHAENHL